jgi:Streptomyces sporulation and cell division protein, SsgA
MRPTDERPCPRTGRLHLDQTIHLVVGTTEALPVTVRFTYDAADPLAVRMDFTGCADVLGPWVFARDLLYAGLRGSSGIGHVRVWPDRRRRGAGSVRILLSDTEGTAMLRVPGAPFEEWLTKTYSVVPAGTEGDHLYWDEVVRRLLRQD